MRRRDFTAGLGSVMVMPLESALVYGQQRADRVRRIAVLIEIAADHPEGQARLGMFVRTLRQLGWTDGGNVQIDTVWSTGDADRSRKYAAEMVTVAPDVILAAGSPTLAAVRQTTRTLPIVFVNIADPVGGGFVDSLARPGGNVTGFALFEYGMSGKWLELLQEIAPRLARRRCLTRFHSRSGCRAV